VLISELGAIFLFVFLFLFKLPVVIPNVAKAEGAADARRQG
jgi:hypothetical protein